MKLVPGHRPANLESRTLPIPLGSVLLTADVGVPEGARGIVVFAHGSGSSRRSPRNRFVASCLNEEGLATVLVDLLTADEEAVDAASPHLRFDIPLLASRLEGICGWVRSEPGVRRLEVGYFGASTGAAAALVAAARTNNEIRAVVSRGGRPDLAAESLDRVDAPTLLVVGSLDSDVLALNREALARLPHGKLQIVPGAGHLFEEPGTLERVCVLASAWFETHLATA